MASTLFSFHEDSHVFMLLLTTNFSRNKQIFHVISDRQEYGWMRTGGRFNLCNICAQQLLSKSFIIGISAPRVSPKLKKLENVTPRKPYSEINSGNKQKKMMQNKIRIQFLAISGIVHAKTQINGGAKVFIFNKTNPILIVLIQEKGDEVNGVSLNLPHVKRNNTFIVTLKFSLLKQNERHHVL